MKTYGTGIKRRQRLADLAYSNKHNLHADTIYNYFIGALSVLVPDDVWNEALGVVKTTIEDMEKFNDEGL